MIRAVLAVVLASALLSVSLPAVDAVARERTAAQLERTVDRIDGAAVDLLADDPGPTAALAPRRLVTVSLPARSLTTARVERLTIDGDTETDGTARVSYHVTGRGSTSRLITVPIATPDGPLVFRAAGDQTLVLRLVRDGERPLVIASRRSSPPPTSESRQDSVPLRSAARIQIPERGQTPA